MSPTAAELHPTRPPGADEPVADLTATGLVSPASRVRHRLLLAGEIGAVDSYSGWLKSRLPVNLNLVDGRTARPEFESALDRASRFLSLATLVTLLVAGSAIALASRRLVERQIDAVAIMRCLGAPRHLLMRVFVLRLVLFGLIASLVGCCGRLAGATRADGRAGGLVRGGPAARVTPARARSASRPG